MIVLETERLILRRLSFDDADFILALLNDPDFIRNIGDRGVRTLADARTFIEKRPLASYAQFGYGLYAVVLKSTGEAIGLCGLIRRNELEHPDLGFAFFPAHRSKGFATESATAVIAYARETLGLERLQAIALPENAPSIRVLGKVGFRPERRLVEMNDGARLEVHALDLVEPRQAPASAAPFAASPASSAARGSGSACSIGFADLYRLAHGRDWTRGEKEMFDALDQSAKNARVEEWAGRAGGIRTEDRRGTDGLVYKAFWKE